MVGLSPPAAGPGHSVAAIAPPPSSRARRGPTTTWRTHALWLVRIALLVAAGWALRRELAGLRWRDLLRPLRDYGWAHVGLGLACTALSFLALGAVELLAVRFSGDSRDGRVPARTGLVTGFTAHAFSQSIGLAVLTGTAVRLRAYERYGLSAAEVARISAFVTLTTTLGLLAVGAWALLDSAARLHVGRTTLSAHPVGGLLALVVLAYLAWSALARGRAVGRGQWAIRRPTPALAAAQLALSALDWLLAGSVLYAFAPATLGAGYWTILRTYMIAQTVGSMSHVPAGAGVLEAVMLTLLVGPAGTSGERAAVVASLVLFRATYYLLPLGAAILVAGAVEYNRSSAPHA